MSNKLRGLLNRPYSLLIDHKDVLHGHMTYPTFIFRCTYEEEQGFSLINNPLNDLLNYKGFSTSRYMHGYMQVLAKSTIQSQS